MPRYSLPARIHQYELIEELPAGMCGAIYKARDEHNNSVVVKFFDHAVQIDPERDRHGRSQTMLSYFTNEQLLLREVTEHRNHQHIVEYVSSNLVRTPYYLVTRFVEGARPLGQFLGAPVKPGFTLQVICQTASALDYLHYAHPAYSPIIHRDVKPSNILIDATGNAVLIDLSIARHPNFQLEVETGLGSPAYMAPEQYEGDEKPSTDQFSLAAVTYHMLTGRKLLPENATAARLKLQNLRVSNYSVVRKQLGKHSATAETLVRALSYAPEARFTTCEDFAHHLRQSMLRDGMNLQVVIEEPQWYAPQRLGWLAMGVVGVVAVAILLMAVLFGGAQQPTITHAFAATTVSIPTGVAVDIQNMLPVPTATLLPSRPEITVSTITLRQREPLRAQPSTNARVLTWMPRDAQAEPTGKQDVQGATTWYEVGYQSLTGWCRSVACQLSTQTKPQ